MKLSVIIVNYKVSILLRQCLGSVKKATDLYADETGHSSEVIVFDNNSRDDSAQMVKQYFPDVKYLASDRNLGFSKANNAAFRQSMGDYILLLNPDTLVPEDLFLKIMPYMEADSEIGALGVKLIDAQGRFHPESKRAYPTPLRAFYKLFGLGRMFPDSERFNKYSLNRLDPDDIHTIEILVGAFMLIRREAAAKTGLFDEDFFMYGEDIDLSYRILKAGYKNVYYGKSAVLHYKGESTKMYSHNYVRVFYQAMRIFIRKHFGGRSRVWATLLNFAVYLRAFLAHGILAAKNIFRNFGSPNDNRKQDINILVIGDEADAEVCRKVFCKTNKQCGIRSVYALPVKTNKEDELRMINEIIKKIRPNTIIYNVDNFQVSIFFELMSLFESTEMSFYSLANGSSCLIGKELVCIEE